MYKKYAKGDYKYAEYKKMMDAIIMVVLFALAMGLFITGYITTGTERNLLTIVAVLGLLPACKMIVSLIMSLRVKTCDIELKNTIDSHLKDAKAIEGFYNMYFTSYDKNYYFEHMILTSNAILALSLNEKLDEKSFGKHMNELLRKEGISDITVKVFKNTDKYIRRIDEINDAHSIEEPGRGLKQFIMNITL